LSIVEYRKRCRCDEKNLDSRLDCGYIETCSDANSLKRKPLDEERDSRIRCVHRLVAALTHK
jgi:hypothetical protein